MDLTGGGTMQNELVSVVVPIYNVQAYLPQCIESILGQSYRNIEIILVDDGSPDESPAICDAYQKKDSRIRVIHKENGGLSDARNAGTAIAQGEYITYVDSDDWIDTEYVEKLLRAAQKYCAEMTVCGLGSTKTREEPPKRNGKECVLTGKEALYKILYQNEMDVSACGKLIRTQIAQKHLFPKGKLFEDLATTYQYVIECKTVVYIGEDLYFYYQNPTSITQSKPNRKRLQIVPIVNELVQEVVQEYPDLQAAAMARKFSVYCYAIRQLNRLNDLDGECAKEVWSFICFYRKQMMLDKNARKKNRAAAILSYTGKNVFSRL